jgi:hypothetical protein
VRVTVAVSKAIRAALAAAGYGKADVSVYNKSYSMGSTVYVTIKRADLALTAVEQIASQHERVDRDSSGEILGGGNCFVDVRYGDGVLDAAAALIAKQLDMGRRRFGSFTLEAGRDPWTLTIWSHNSHGESRPGLNVDANDPSEAIARVLASAGALTALENDDDACPECGLFDAHEGLCAGPANDATPIITRTEAETEAAADGICAALDQWVPGVQRGIDAHEQAALIARGNAVAVEMFGPALTPALPVPRRDGETDGAYTARLAGRVVRAAERWQAAFPCPPRASEPRLHALWVAVERLVAHDEGRAPFVEGDQSPPA